MIPAAITLALCAIALIVINSRRRSAAVIITPPRRPDRVADRPEILSNTEVLPPADEICSYYYDLYHTDDLIGRLKREHPRRE